MKYTSSWNVLMLSLMSENLVSGLFMWVKSLLKCKFVGNIKICIQNNRNIKNFTI